MKYIFMLGIAFILAVISSIMTALGMMDLFNAVGILILVLFIIIDLGRFILFSFLVDEWNNLRGIKYFVSFIIAILFIYSAVGIYSKLDSLVSTETKQAMVDMAALNEKASNAEVKKNRSEDLMSIAKKEYENAMTWNELDYKNCLNRAKIAKNIHYAENSCNNTKRRLDKNALTTYEAAIKKADETLNLTETAIQISNKNKSEIASVLTTICKLTQKDCTTYDSLQNALTILIFLVIIGTDYLQIAIILAVNTRKNKNNKTTYETEIVPDGQKNDINEDSFQREFVVEEKEEKNEIEFLDINQNSVASINNLNNTENKEEVSQKPIKKIIKNIVKPHSKFVFHGPKPRNISTKK